MLRRVFVNGRMIEYELIQTARSSVELRAQEQSPPRLFTPKGYRLRDADEFVRARGLACAHHAAHARVSRAAAA